jgi:hypothetical protein
MPIIAAIIGATVAVATTAVGIGVGAHTAKETKKTTEDNAYKTALVNSANAAANQPGAIHVTQQ